MAPKHPAALASPPPVESSAETALGSDSEASSEEIAYSPPPAVPTPPPQKVQQPEDSDDEDEDEDGEEEEEEEEENEEEESEDSSAPQSPPHPQSELEESDESDDEEEEEWSDDEALQPELDPTQEGADGKKPTAPIRRSWSKDDEVRILEAAAAHRREHGKLPQPEDLEAALAGTLDSSDHGLKELAAKLKNLRTKYIKTAKGVDLPTDDLDRRIFDLSKEVWGGDVSSVNSDIVRRDYGEMCRMYPYLAEEINALEKKHPGLFKRQFCTIGDDKARDLNQKIKKRRAAQMKLELRRMDITKEVTKTLMSLVD